MSRSLNLGTALLMAAFFGQPLNAADPPPPVTPEKVWSTDGTIGPVDSTPALDGAGMLYFGTFRQRFVAMTTNGEVKWTFRTGSEIKSSPAIAEDGTLYFGCRDRKLYALTSGGEKRWEFATGGWVDSSPALAEDGTICFGSWDRHFYALSRDGSLKWKFETGGEIDSSAAIDAEGTLYFGSHDRRLYALAPDGTKKWEFAAGAPIISSPALNGKGLIYFTSVDGFLYVLNADGTLHWKLRTGGTTASSPVLGSDGSIYLGVNREFWAVSPEGKRKWHWILGDLVYCAPTVAAGDVIYGVSRFGDVFVTDAEQKLLMRFHIYGGTHASIVLGPEGTAYTPYGQVSLVAWGCGTPLGKTPWPTFRGDARNTGRIQSGSSARSE